MSILKNITLIFAFVLMIGFYVVVLFQGFFPEDEIMEKKVAFAEERAIKRAEAIKNLQKEWLEQQR